MGPAIDYGDVEALLDLFRPEAVFVDTGTGSARRGHDDFCAAVTVMLESRPRLTGTDPAVVVAGDFAPVVSAWTLNAVGPDGESVRDSGTATVVMRRQPNGTGPYVVDNPGGTDLGRRPSA